MHTTEADARIVIDDLLRKNLWDPIALIRKTRAIEREIAERIKPLLKEIAQ